MCCRGSSLALSLRPPTACLTGDNWAASSSLSCSLEVRRDASFVRVVLRWIWRFEIENIRFCGFLS